MGNICSTCINHNDQNDHQNPSGSKFKRPVSDLVQDNEPVQHSNYSDCSDFAENDKN